MTQKRLNRLLKALENRQRLLILPHNDPDPDAIASAMALCYLLHEASDTEAKIVYQGIIGRAENEALVQYLGHPLRRLKPSDLHDVSIALVDTQPGAGNNPLPPDLTPILVIDHHDWRESTSGATFYDVRPDLGSTATMLTEYLRAGGLSPSLPLATALFYGIKTDTMGLARSASPADVEAYFYLQPHIDVEALVQIERAQVPAEYFQSLVATLQATQTYDGVAVAYTGLVNRPDLPAEMADLLLRLEGTQWVICMGVHEDELILAIRTRDHNGNAGLMAQNIVGERGTAGGHGVMAGGQVPLSGQAPMELVDHLTQKMLQYLQVGETKGKPLVGNDVKPVHHQ